MKKTTIVSIVLALMLAAYAAVAATPAIAKKKKAALKMDKLFRRNHNDKKKRYGSCSAITCLDEGETCDNDDDTMICMNDFYCDNDKCIPPKGEGEPCSSDSECGGDLMCNITRDNKIPSVCIQYPEKVGDSCSIYRNYCPTGTKCVYGVCTIYPTTVGADCVENPGCNNNSLYCNSEHKCAEYPKAGENCLNGNCADYHYCDDGSNKCVKYPGEGEDCHNRKCDSGLYCNYTNENKCIKSPGLGEECSYNSGCASGLACDYDQDSGKYVCFNKIGDEGEHCSNYVSCGDGLACNNNHKCVVSECKEDYDCPSGKGCNNLKCIDFMSLNDGEECGPSDTINFFCKEGSGCGWNKSSSTRYSCMKVTTKISDEIVCEDDECPSDSYCGCNSANGKTQCIPYHVSNKTVVGYYKKLLTAVTTGEYSDELKAYSIFIIQYAYPVDEDFICYTVNYTILEGGDKGIASNIKPSFALSAVLFVFGFIAAVL